MRTSFWHLIVKKTCAEFFFLRFYFRFLIFILTYGLPMKFFFNNLADFVLNFIILFYKFIIFIKKYINLVSSKFPLYALMFGSIAHKGPNFLPSLFPVKYLKLFFTKKSPLRHYYFTNAYIIYRNWTFVLVNFNVAKLYNFFTHIW